MKPSESTRRIKLTPDNNERLAKLFGQFDENLHLIERYLGVEINNPSNDFEIIGIPKSVDKAAEVLKSLYKETAYRRNITANEVLLHIREINYQTPKSSHKEKAEYELKVSQLRVKARTPNQQHYLNAIQKYDINFGIGSGGSSGTEKTFLAVACAIAALEKEEVSRIVLTRPAVEAGEKLGYLPRDLTQKIDPSYLCHLYDVLFEMLEPTESGLRHAIPLLRDIDEIQFTFFKSNDIVRHPVVQRIIEAYEEENEASY